MNTVAVIMQTFLYLGELIGKLLEQEPDVEVAKQEALARLAELQIKWAGVDATHQLWQDELDRAVPSGDSE